MAASAAFLYLSAPNTTGVTMPLLKKLGIHYNDRRENPIIMGGAGLCKTSDPIQVGPFSRAFDLGVIGSITVEARPGNDGVLEYFDLETGARINAWGMPNHGLAGMRPAAGPNLIASIAGFSVDEYITLYDALKTWGRGLELNCGCPNAGHDILSFDVDAMDQILSGISDMKPPSDMILGLKVSPFSNPNNLSKAAEMFNSYSHILDYIATCNTFPDATLVDEDGNWGLTTMQQAEFGGLSGPPLYPISLGQGKKFRSKLHGDIDVVQVGGISTGRHVRTSIDADFTAVQVVSAVREDFNEVTRIRSEYGELLAA
jgi:dihydroorotate dehydrogenase